MATDPSDWKFTPLKEIDSLLRCPICFEYLTTAVMLPACSHNYCSLCIRRYLGHKQQCPTCSAAWEMEWIPIPRNVGFEIIMLACVKSPRYGCRWKLGGDYSANQPVGEADLKCNRLLDELVVCFIGNRHGFLALSQLSMLRAREKEGVSSGDGGSSAGCEGGEVLGEEESVKWEGKMRHGGRRKDGERKRKGLSLSVLSSQIEAKIPTLSKALLHTNGLCVGGTGSLSERITKETFHVPESPMVTNIELDFGGVSDGEGSDTPPLTSVVVTPKTICTTKPSLELDSEEVIFRPSLKLRTPRKKGRKINCHVKEADVSLSKDDSSSVGDSTPPLVVGDRVSMNAEVTTGRRESGIMESGNMDVKRSSTSSEPDGELLKVVVCPVCGKHTKANLINAHLDRCLSDPFPTLPLLSNPPPLPSTPPPSRVPPQIVCDGGIIYKRGSSLPRLPKIVLSIMKDRELRKKLKEYHLPTHGQRAALIARLEEFTLQYKAQQDSLCPKSVKEIAEDVEKAERKLPFMKPVALNSSTSATQLSRRNASPSDIEEERKCYAEKHGDQFAQLIAAMRERRKVTAIRNSVPSGAISATESQASMKDRVGGSEGVVATDSVLAGESSSEGDEEWWAKIEEEEDGSANTTLTSTIPESPTTPKDNTSCQSFNLSNLTSPSLHMSPPYTSHITSSTSFSQKNLPPSSPSLCILDEGEDGVVSTKRPRLQERRDDTAERLSTPPRTRSRFRRSII